MKAVAQLDEDFARLEVMGAPEGETVVEKHAAIGDVDGLEVDDEALAKLFAEREVKRSMRLKMITWCHCRRVAIGKA